LIANTTRLNLAGHVIRINDSEIPKRVMNYESEGKRRVGRYKAR
jgi:hypothetical protein